MSLMQHHSTAIATAIPTKAPIPNDAVCVAAAPTAIEDDAGEALEAEAPVAAEAAVLPTAVEDGANPLVSEGALVDAGAVGAAEGAAVDPPRASRPAVIVTGT